MKKIILLCLTWLLMSQVFAQTDPQSVGLYIKSMTRSTDGYVNSICLGTANSYSVCGNRDTDVSNPKAWKLYSANYFYPLYGDESCVPFIFWQLTPIPPQGIKLYLSAERKLVEGRTFIYLSNCVLS